MNQPLLLLVALVALPVVLLMTTAGCKKFEASAPDTYAVMIGKTPRLRGYWRLNEGQDATVASDSSSLAMHGVYKNSTSGNILFSQPGALVPAGEKADTAPEFIPNGYGYVDISDTAGRTSPPEFSIECWFKLKQPQPGTEILLGCYGLNSAGQMTAGYHIELDRVPDGSTELVKITGRLNPDIVLEASLGEAPLHEGWHHVVLTHEVADGGTTRLYVDASDGTPSVSVAGRRYVPNSKEAHPLRLAAGLGSPDPPRPANYFYRGLLDEVALYNVALFDDQVKEHFNHRL
ncbi:LamG domain-containing protein [Streptomyces chartreusis]|uniref:LamG domain-containing protein n=1 Tax=Streptomyces chartreusis TaxID=1969 RepID=UPI0034286D0B